jgi:hypothetical protein
MEEIKLKIYAKFVFFLLYLVDYMNVVGDYVK